MCLKRISNFLRFKMNMKLSDIISLLECEILANGNFDEVEITKTLASDMMSDVLAFAQPGALLVTGLVNSQSVRTADIADAAGIIYIRGKKPDEQTLNLANEMGIPVFATTRGMFEVCAMLHSIGLKGIC